MQKLIVLIDKYLTKIDKYLTKTVESVLSLLFVLIFLMVFNQVVLRYLFSASIMGTAELFTVLFAYASALGTAVMIRHREHIKISFFLDKLPLRGKKFVLTINYILIGLFNAVVVYQSINWLHSIKDFRSQVTGISRAVESLSIPVGFGLALFYCALNILKIYTRPEELHLETTSLEMEVQGLLAEAAESDRPAPV